MPPSDDLYRYDPSGAPSDPDPGSAGTGAMGPSTYLATFMGNAPDLGSLDPREAQRRAVEVLRALHGARPQQLPEDLRARARWALEHNLVNLSPDTGLLHLTVRGEQMVTVLSRLLAKDAPTPRARGRSGAKALE
jgi:hypothetical protein